MKKVKEIDLYIQILLLLTWLLSLCFKINYVFYGYFIVGSWHLLSLIFYWIVGSHSQEAHHKIIRIIIGTLLLLVGVACIINPLIYVLFFVLIITTPPLAIYYSCVCFMEIKDLQKRPLYQLK